MASLIIADDHPLMLQGVAGLFADSRFEVVARCLDGQQARDAILELTPDLAILDIHMPRLSGVDVLRQARAERWRTRIVLLTAGLEPQPILESIRLKVDGLVLKDAGGEMLLRCAEQVCAGQQWLDKEALQQVVGMLAGPDEGAPPDLTPREGDVVRLVVLGRRNKEIARDLGISEGTVKMHLHNLYEKLSVSSRTELAILARERHLG
jgi:DNA-binding NarL/FixJ family response regulator